MPHQNHPTVVTKVDNVEVIHVVHLDPKLVTICCNMSFSYLFNCLRKKMCLIVRKCD